MIESVAGGTDMADLMFRLLALDPTESAYALLVLLNTLVPNLI